MQNLDNLNLCINGVEIKEKWCYVDEKEENEQSVNSGKATNLTKWVRESELKQVEDNDKQQQEIDPVKNRELVNKWIHNPIKLEINSSFVIDEGYDRHQFNLVRVYLNDEELICKWRDDPRQDKSRPFTPRIYGPRSPTSTQYVMLILYILNIMLSLHFEYHLYS